MSNCSLLANFLILFKLDTFGLVVVIVLVVVAGLAFVVLFVVIGFAFVVRFAFVVLFVVVGLVGVAVSGLV